MARDNYPLMRFGKAGVWCGWTGVTHAKTGRDMGMVRRADPSGAPHTRPGGWWAKTPRGEIKTGFATRKDAGEWLCTR